MKKVLFILPSLKTGGLERTLVTLANALSENNYEVTVMTLNEGDELVSELRKTVCFVHKPYKSHSLMKKIPFIRNRLYDDGMWETRARSKQLHDYYIGDAKYNVEIAFFHGLPIKIVSGGIKDKLKQLHVTRRVLNNSFIFSKTVLQNMKDQTKHLAWVHTDFRKTKGYTNQFKCLDDVRCAYALFDNVVCVSNEAKKSFIDTIGNTGNLITMYNMLPVKEILAKADETLFTPTRKSGFHLVLVGRLLDKTKGQVRLIHVISRLKQEDYDISLTLVGDGQDRDRIKNEILILDAGKYITMVGNQANPYPYIKEADLLVCASYYEGFNLTVAEALIIGTPVLSTNCAGPNEILDYGRYGMIVKSSEEGLYNGIVNLINDRSKAKYFIEKAKERCFYFDIEKNINKVIQLIEED